MFAFPITFFKKEEAVLPPTVTSMSFVGHYDATDPSGFTTTGSDVDTIVNLAPGATSASDLIFIPDLGTGFTNWSTDGIKATTGGNINGKNAFNFAGGRYQNSAFYAPFKDPSSNDYLLAFVYYPIASAQTPQHVASSGSATDWKYGFAFNINTGYERRVVEIAGESPSASGGTAANGVPEVIMLEYNYQHGGCRLYINDGSDSSHVAEISASDPHQGYIALGGTQNLWSEYPAGGERYFYGTIGEVLYYTIPNPGDLYTGPFQIDPAERVAVMDYLKSKWGIA